MYTKREQVAVNPGDRRGRRHELSKYGHASVIVEDDPTDHLQLSTIDGQITQVHSCISKSEWNYFISLQYE